MLAKKPSCEALTEQLNAAREKRNEQQNKLEALLMARELIVHAIPQVHVLFNYHTIICFSQSHFIVLVSYFKKSKRFSFTEKTAGLAILQVSVKFIPFHLYMLQLNFSFRSNFFKLGYNFLNYNVVWNF